MNIVELHCEPNHKNVTVCLSYENIREAVQTTLNNAPTIIESRNDDNG